MLQPPQALASPPQRESALDYEIAREQATALGRLGRSLEVALAALAEFDHDKRERAEQTTSSRDARMSLVQAAGEALWCFVIQREACGLRDPRPVLRSYGVPADVINRMGTFGHRPDRTPERPAGSISQK